MPIKRWSSERMSKRPTLAPYEGIARMVIMRRAELGLTQQQQLAERMGTSHSAISRIESGQHRTSVARLERVARALDLRFLVGLRERTGRLADPRARHPLRQRSRGVIRGEATHRNGRFR